MVDPLDEFKGKFSKEDISRMVADPTILIKRYWKDRQRELGSFNCPKCGKKMRWKLMLVICDDCNSAWSVNPYTRELK